MYTLSFENILLISNKLISNAILRKLSKNAIDSGKTWVNIKF